MQWDDLWDGGDQWTQGFQTTSETFAMQRRDELQVFTFKEPILCVGGLFKVKCWAHSTQGPAQDCLIATSSSPHAQLSHACAGVACSLHCRCNDCHTHLLGCEPIFCGCWILT